MARRTEILDYLATQLRLIEGVAKVHRSYKYLNDINDFPTITLGATPREDYDIEGNGQLLKSVRQSIRAYVMSDDDSLFDTENLANDIETVVSSYAANAANLGVHRSQVIALQTDEGLLSPYGLCELEVEIYYDGDETY